MTAVSKIVYVDVLDYIVNKYNNTVHRTIKMLNTMEILITIKPKFKVGHYVKISKCKYLVAKGYT